LTSWLGFAPSFGAQVTGLEQRKQKCDTSPHVYSLRLDGHFQQSTQGAVVPCKWAWLLPLLRGGLLACPCCKRCAPAASAAPWRRRSPARGWGRSSTARGWGRRSPARGWGRSSTHCDKGSFPNPFHTGSHLEVIWNCFGSDMELSWNAGGTDLECFVKRGWNLRGSRAARAPQG
jgi:hypothetical protein